MAKLGGSGRAYLFRVKSDLSALTDAATGLTDLTTPFATNAAMQSAAALQIGGKDGAPLEQTDITPADDNTFTIKFTQYDSSKVFEDFLDIAVVRKAGSVTTGAPEVKDEAGIINLTAGTASSDTPRYLLITYSSVDSGKRMAKMYLVTVTATSGAVTYKNNEWVKPTLEMKSVASSMSTALTIDKSIFDTDLVTAPASDASFPSGGYYEAKVELTAKA